MCVTRKQLSSYVPKHILDIGRPKRKEGGRSSGAGDRRSSIDKPLSSSSKQEQPDASKSSTGADEDETSQESQSVDVSGSGAEIPSDQADSMVWHPSDNSSTNAVPASESGSERNVSKEHTEVSVSPAGNSWVLNIDSLIDDTPSPNHLSNVYCLINDILSTNHLSNS